ncbi:MAG: hypothetical protein Q4C81_10175 [Kocuria sp.]|nr:hypothetical protein [Kocuria sp.]
MTQLTKATVRDGGQAESLLVMASQAWDGLGGGATRSSREGFDCPG